MNTTQRYLENYDAVKEKLVVGCSVRSRDLPCTTRSPHDHLKRIIKDLIFKGMDIVREERKEHGKTYLYRLK